MPKYIKINESITFDDDYCEYDEDGDCVFYEIWQNIQINSISIVNESSYHDIIVGDNFKKEDIVYLVYVCFSSGSSSERHHGNHSYINIFKDKNKALELVKMIEEESNSEERYNVEYLTDSGKMMTCFSGIWSGYFDSFVSVDCLEMILE